MAPPATAAAAGVPVQALIAAGVTAFAVAVPPFFTARVAVKTWLVSAVVRLGVSVAVSVAGDCTVTEAVAVPVESVAPLFASVPLAEVLSASVPVAVVEHPVKTKFTVVPPATTAAAGVPVHADMATAVTALAFAVPLFFTASVAVNVWLVSTVDWLGVRVAVSVPAAWTVTVAVTVPVVTVAALFASVPLAEVLSVSVPAVVLEQPV
ncbi:MAG TPA: hypothetical protein VMS64_10035 [Candidatus Methylomirabilis sp.]|nr:hypothetical protein [Candidatus Methylomirabilis sp.]